MGSKNLVQVHVEPEQRLPILILLPFELQRALYPKWAWGKSIAKQLFPSENTAEANKSETGLDIACSQEAQEL